MREALLGSVGVNASAGEFPEQPAIDCAEGELAGVCMGARARDVLEDPGNFGGRKIRIDQETSTLLDERTVALAAEALAEIGGAAILPDDCVADWVARVAIPYDCRLALVGDADGGDVAGSRADFG